MILHHRRLQTASVQTSTVTAEDAATSTHERRDAQVFRPLRLQLSIFLNDGAKQIQTEAVEDANQTETPEDEQRVSRQVLRRESGFSLAALAASISTSNRRPREQGTDPEHAFVRF